MKETTKSGSENERQKKNRIEISAVVVGGRIEMNKQQQHKLTTTSSAAQQENWFSFAFLVLFHLGIARIHLSRSVTHFVFCFFGRTLAQCRYRF